MQGAFHSTKTPETSKTGANGMEISEKRFPEIRKLFGRFPFHQRSQFKVLKFPVVNGKAFSGFFGEEVFHQIFVQPISGFSSTITLCGYRARIYTFTSFSLSSGF